MRLSKFKLVFIAVIVLIFSSTFTTTVYSDSQSGWRGYGLYNLSDSKAEIIRENVSIEIEDDKLHYKGEFAIRNLTNVENRVALGISANGVQKITMQEKGSLIKWRKRSLEGLQSEFNLSNKLPEENYWYVFNTTLDPAETSIFSVEVDAVQNADEDGTYTLDYFGDRKLGFPNKAEKSSLYIKINNFEPCNILSLRGLNPAGISQNGEILQEADEKSLEAISIKYKDITAQAVSKLLKSPMHKTREVALAFNDMNYDRAALLCDEYLKNPTDESLNNEQFLFIKAESLRRLYKYDKYLELVENLNYGKLYPAELKNKIYQDRLDIYMEQQSQDKIENLSKELYLLSEESTEFLTAWMEDRGYFNADESDKKPAVETKAEGEPEGRTAAIIQQWYKQAMSIPYTPLLIFLLGLILGILLRGSSGRKRRRRGYGYIYRM